MLNHQLSLKMLNPVLSPQDTEPTLIQQNVEPALVPQNAQPIPIPQNAPVAPVSQNAPVAPVPQNAPVATVFSKMLQLQQYLVLFLSFFVTRALVMSTVRFCDIMALLNFVMALFDSFLFIFVYVYTTGQIPFRFFPIFFVLLPSFFYFLQNVYNYCL